MTIVRIPPETELNARNQTGTRSAALRGDSLTDRNQLLASGTEMATEAEAIRRSERAYIREAGSTGNPPRINEATLRDIPKDSPGITVNTNFGSARIEWTPGDEVARSLGQTHVYKLSYELRNPGNQNQELMSAVVLEPTAVITDREKSAIESILGAVDIPIDQKLIRLNNIVRSANSYLEEDRARSGSNATRISWNGEEREALTGFNAAHDDLVGASFNNVEIKAGLFTGTRFRGVIGDKLYLNGCDLRGEGALDLTLRGPGAGLDNCILRGRDLSTLRLDLETGTFKNNIVSDCIFENERTGARSPISVELEALARAYAAASGDRAAQERIAKVAIRNFALMTYNDQTIFAADREANTLIFAMLDAISDPVDPPGIITNGELVSSLIGSPGLSTQLIMREVGGETAQMYRVFLGGKREVTFSADSLEGNQCEIIFASGMPEEISPGTTMTATELLALLAETIEERKRREAKDRDNRGEGGERRVRSPGVEANPAAPEAPSAQAEPTSTSKSTSEEKSGQSGTVLGDRGMVINASQGATVNIMTEGTANRIVNNGKTEPAES